ncbi:MAG: hypothetical protein ACE5FT_04405 [Candidatus Nanoarchaeia archaeon]
MKYLAYALMFMLLVSVVFAQSGATTYGGVIVEEGSVKEFLTATQVFKVKVLSVADATSEVVFELNGEISKALEEREKHTFSDGSIVVVSDVLIDEGADGPDLVQFYFVAGRGSPITRLDPEPEGAEYDLSGLAQLGEIEQPKAAALDFTDVETECLTAGNCNDKNPCSIDRCLNGECAYEFLKGCPISDRCIPYQEVITNGGGVRKYCALTGEVVEQREDGASCMNSFECKNKCIDGVCAEHMEIVVPEVEEPTVAEVVETPEVGVLRRFLVWLGGLFG